MKRSTKWFIALLGLSVTACAAVIALISGTHERSFSHHRSVLAIDLSGAWPERDSNAPLDGLLGAPALTMRDLVDSIDAAAHDDDIAAMELNVGDLSIGWAKAQEIRDSILRFEESNKPVHAHLDGGNDGSYFLASAANEVSMLETGTLWLDGISAEVSFYGGTLEKVGVSADLEQIGEYKNAADVMKRKDMTPAHREAMDSLLDGLYGEIVTALATSLGKTPAEVEEIVSNGPYTARGAKDAGLVDTIAYEDEAREALDKALGGARPERIGLRRYARQLARPRGARTIAVIDCSGTIVSGESSNGVLGGSQMGSDTIADAIRDARKIPGVAALILRVDSPGGSPVASDVIWRETIRAKENGLPVVVSMSDVAASGGYWISMGADKVVAEPATITGSIGIFGGKYVTQGLEDKLGLHVESVHRGAHAAINSGQAPFTPDERAWLKAELGGIYRLFIERTADGRGFASPEAVDRIARGRVWTGRQAKERGLVDELGGLDHAISVAKGLANIPDAQDVTLTWLPRAPTLAELLFDGGPASFAARCAAFAAASDVQRSIPDAVRELLPDAGVLRVLEREGAIAYMPLRVLAR